MRMTGECSCTSARVFSRAAVLMAFAVVSFSHSRSLVAQEIPKTVCVDKRGCGGSPAAPTRTGSSDNSAANDAARAEAARAAAAAEAAAEWAAEAKRRSAVEQRAAEVKRAADRAEAQAAFVRELGTVKLKGRTGGSPTLKGSAAKAEGGLTLKSGSPPAKSPAEMQKLAWKQLHCATAFARKALEALQMQSGISDFRSLQSDALSALDGAKVDTPCDPAPEMPEHNSTGAPVDIAAGKTAERVILQQAGEIATVMEAQAPALGSAAVISPSRPAPAVETPIEKLRRVQRELNQINSQKTGTTQASINERETIRLKLSNLVLVNNNLAKGETVDLSVILTDSPAQPAKTPPKVPKSKR